MRIHQNLINCLYRIINYYRDHMKDSFSLPIHVYMNNIKIIVHTAHVGILFHYKIMIYTLRTVWVIS